MLGLACQLAQPFWLEGAVRSPHPSSRGKDVAGRSGYRGFAGASDPGSRFLSAAHRKG